MDAIGATVVVTLTDGVRMPHAAYGRERKPTHGMYIRHRSSPSLSATAGKPAHKKNPRSMAGRAASL